MKLSRTKQIEKEIKKTTLDIKAIMEEHDRYKFKSDKEAYAFMESLPIETLTDSLNKDLGKPRSRISLKDIPHVNKLHREFDEKQESLKKLKNDLFIAQIDELQEKINNIIGE